MSTSTAATAAEAAPQASPLRSGSRARARTRPSLEPRLVWQRVIPLQRPSGHQNNGEETPTIVLVAAVALIDTDGRVLLAERPAGKHLAAWEFPGGKVHDGRNAGSGADPRARRGARHLGARELPGAVHLRLAPYETSTC